ncbi:MAG: hypothetical protein ACO4AU_11955 [bacterium]|jgi:hypothetical protein
MKLPARLESTPAPVLRSGAFYAVRYVHRCYRINEPDHFLKDLEGCVFSYLDREGTLHHFNRPGSQQSAASPVAEVLRIQGLKEVEFFEIDPKQAGMVKPEGAEEERAMALLDKAIAAFSGRTAEDQGQEYEVEELKRQHMKDYITPPDLAL